MSVGTSTPSTEIVDLATRVRSGDRRALARSLSIIEESGPGSGLLNRELFAQPGAAAVVGVTGPPGAGKSSLVNCLVGRARTAGHRVGVLAVDPSSPLTGGALLGDRLRMDDHASDSEVFVRSMAARGHLGGMSTASPEAVRAFEAWGADIVILETVGVGQSEVEIAGSADSVVVVVAPGFGDSIQAAKAGVLEIADILVVNKSDVAGASDAVRWLEANLHLGPESPWRTPVLSTSAPTRGGIDELWETLEQHRQHLIDSGELARRSNSRLVDEVERRAVDRFRALVSPALRSPALEDVSREVTSGAIDPAEAAGLVLERVLRREVISPQSASDSTRPEDV